ncbi:MAG: GNAT family N-acetyltransferase [Elainellaceae cyanobacterium]
MAEEILDFSPDYLNACAHIMVAVSNREPWHENWTVETAQTRLWEIANTPGFIGLIYWSGGVVGYAFGCCEQWDMSKNFCLYEIAVKPDMQRKGIGRKLVSQLERVLVKQGVTKVYLATLRDSNAEDFYRKQGYRESKNVMTMVRFLDSSTLNATNQ